MEEVKNEKFEVKKMTKTNKHAHTHIYIDAQKEPLPRSAESEWKTDK